MSIQSNTIELRSILEQANALPDAFTPPESEYLSPEFVYKTTRPKDWLPMPRPGDNEVYLLGHILPNINGYFYVKLTFTGTASIEIGNLVNGAFVTKASYTPVSDTPFSCVVNYADYGDELADGTRQYMTRISGAAITRVNLQYGETLNIPMPLIVDAVCGIPLDRFTCGNYNNLKQTLQQLKYLRFVGKGRPGWINGNEFVGMCKALMSIDCEANNTSNYASYSFFGCTSLWAVSPNIFAGITNSMSRCFHASGILGVSLGHIAPTDTSWGFRDDAHFKQFTPDTLNTSKVQNFECMFYQCSSLRQVIGLNILSATQVDSLFTGCDSLSRLTFAGETTPGGWTLSLTDTALCHDALVEMIASLPVATAAATIAIMGNPGASELTDAEIAVATAKNWTITR